ncbi:MAG: hypothetical protein HWN71_02050 [Desulfobacterales bacterium]|nr:hypothetical protein [Desulfobacterales bacterium]
MSRNDLIQPEGVVARVLGGRIVEIECEDNVTVRGVLCGRYVMAITHGKAPQGD